MALFRMLGIVASSLWVSAEDARSCPIGYYCPQQTRAWDQQSRQGFFRNGVPYVGWDWVPSPKEVSHRAT